MKTDTKAIKEEMLKKLARTSSEMSDKQIRSHWLEWIDQAFDEAFASHNQSLREQIKEMPVRMESILEGGKKYPFIIRDDVLSLLTPESIFDDNVHQAVKEAAIATEYCPTHKEYHGVHKLLDKSFIQTAKKADEAWDGEKCLSCGKSL